jgi:hypothetical protein
VSDDEPVKNADRYEWERLVRRCRLPATTKLVAAMMAHYANRDGSRIYPGVARLSAVTGLSERSVRAALGQLRDLDLITRTRKGSSLGRQALTDEHKLTYPADLERRVHLLDPDESPESAACDQSCKHPRTPARPAADKAARTTEHRHLTTRTPANGAGTPANDDRNTGTTCTPPTHDHPLDQPKDQREISDRYVSTESGDNVLAQLIAIDELAARRAANQ